VVAGLATAAAVVEVADRLPEDLGVFTGRRAELTEIAKLADAAPASAVVVAIEGMAGVGKTRLAVHAGHLMLRRGRYTDLQLAVDLRGYDPQRPPADPFAVLGQFLRRLGVPAGEVQHLDLAGRAARYRRLLSGTNALILLDNAGSAAQVRPLLPDGAGCPVLVTSRQALADLPGVTRLRLDVFTREDAANLLRLAAGADRIGADPGAADRIAELLGRLPLALALVAARIRLNPDWTLADHLERLLRRRASGRLEDDVETALGLSYDELSPDQRRTFRLLSVQPGSDIDAHAAAALAGTDLDTARAHLDRLLAGNLLQQTTRGRYGFHDQIRLYAGNRTDDEDPARSRRAALTRLLNYYGYVAATAMDNYAPHEKDRPRVPTPNTPTPRVTSPEAATAWLDTERSNLIAAATCAADHDLSAHTSRLSATLGRYLLTAGRYRDAQILHSRALRAAEPTGAGAELRNLGRIYWHQGRYRQALDSCQQALAVAREAGDLPAEQRASSALGTVCFSLGHRAEALGHGRRALAIARQLHDRAAEEKAIGNLGKMHLGFGRYPQAMDHFQQALTIACQLGDHLGEGIAHGNLADLLARLGHHDQALRHCQQAIRLHREIGSRTNQPGILDQLGTLHARLGHHHEALDHHRQALTIARETGNRNAEGHALDNLGTAHTLLGHHHKALDLHRQALTIARDIGNPADECQTLNNLGNLYGHLERHEEALDHHRQALTLAERLADPYAQAQAHDGVAQALTLLGDDQSAQPHRRQTLRLLNELGISHTAHG
jgi:tetratricopeptide (TPR) repeat protein